MVIKRIRLRDIINDGLRIAFINYYFNYIFIYRIRIMANNVSYKY